MATVVNNPSGEQTSSLGLLLGVIVAIIALFAIFFYGIPALRSGAGTNINVPDKVDLNVNQGANGQ